MTGTLISACGLSVARGGRTLLDGVDLSVARGEIVTLVGPNGSGKTTLLRLLIGAMRPDSGTVSTCPGLAMGYAPQRFALDQTLPLTVDRFVALGQDRPAKAPARAEILALCGMGEFGGAQLVGLSGGEFQRVVMARALVRKPDLLILDEPTQGLDQSGEAELYRLIEQARDDLNCGVLLVSHDLHVVMRAADKVVCLNGHVCCSGTPEQVSASTEYRRLFGTHTQGALALYRHTHDHEHPHGH